MIENIIIAFGSFLIEHILDIAQFCIKIILSPIDAIISNALPSVSMISNYISTFLDYIFQYVGWALDILAIPSGLISLIISYFVLKYLIYFEVYLIKLVLGWLKK